MPTDWETLLDERVRSARDRLAESVSPRPAALRSSTSVRPRRRVLLAVAGVAVTVALVWATTSVLSDGDGDDEPVIADQPEVPAPDDDNAHLLEPGEARAIAPSPLSGRSTMASVWTGDEMLVWGGESPGGFHADGAAYDPVTDSWRLLSPSPLSPRNSPAVVWTGERAIFWGGHGPDGGTADGAMYDPATDSWQPITDAPIASDGGPHAVWTGSEMLTLVGINSFQTMAYDPAADSWRVLDPVPGQPAGPFIQSEWTGSHWVIAATGASPDLNPGAAVFAFNVETDRWEDLPPVGDGAASVALTWTDVGLVGATLRPGRPVLITDPESRQSSVVAAWPDAAGGPYDVWTGSRVLYWNGDGATLFDPTTGAFDTTPAGDGPGRVHPALVWADGVLIVWGGWQDMNDGLMLRPIDPPSQAPGTTVAVTIPGDPETGELTPVMSHDGVTVGYVDFEAGPTEVNGHLYPLHEIVDEDGNLIAYFGCSWLDRDVVEAENFDPSQICADTPVPTEGG